ncbi:MAG TPA: hypothetical protein VHC21_03965 [Candidatus Saccharimonadales bacterium]|nr:hypothetical protein [Candidatus Saccharimonadales bacterium]
MRFETHWVQLDHWTTRDQHGKMCDKISAVHQRAAELGGKVISSVADNDVGIYMTTVLPETLEEENVLALIPPAPDQNAER